MLSISSVSGGKTSAYMAVNYPTDHYVFAVVLSNHEASAPKDKGLLRECRDRIPHFVASHEADLTLANVLRLEQLIGRKINWVAAEFSLEEFALGQTLLPGYRTRHAMLPNKRRRFCTTQCKILPIFWHCHLNYFDSDPILMNIGFRWDERSRVEGWNCKNDIIKYSDRCTLSGKHQYKSLEWRVVDFPLYRERISHDVVRAFWQKQNWQFPEISNCRFCFNHTKTQQRRQALLEPENLKSWQTMEEVSGKTFQDISLAGILRQPLLDVFESDRADVVCSACTD